MSMVTWISQLAAGLLRRRRRETPPTARVILGPPAWAEMPRYLFIFGPANDFDMAVAEQMIIGFNLQSLLVFYSMDEKRAFTAAEISERLAQASEDE